LIGERKTLAILAATLAILARTPAVLGIKVAVLARIVLSWGGEA
jgi:hypothetical protein